MTENCLDLNFVLTCQDQNFSYKGPPTTNGPQFPPTNGTQVPPINTTQVQPINGPQVPLMNGTQGPPTNGPQAFSYPEWPRSINCEPG
jgi:hypothetical protein